MYDGRVSGEDQASYLRAVRAAREGDPAAFNAVVLATQRHVYNLCRRTLGNAEDAADATQEAYLRAHRSVSSFRGHEAEFKPWLLRIAVNACYDQLRQRRRRPTEPLDGGGDDGAFDPPSPDLAPDDLAELSETRRAVEDGIAHLPLEHRLVVILCDVQGHSYVEAAAVLDVELGTVKSRLSRARAALRDYLRARGELPARTRRLNE